MYLLIGLAVALISVQGSVWASVQERIIYSFPGNTLIAYSGTKSKVVITERNAFPQTGGPSVTLWGKTKYLYDSDSTPYGNGSVESWFNSTVLYDAWTLPYWAEVEGESNTAWWGTEPQIDSSRIRLDESWSFNGWSVYLSYPPGFSSSGHTVTWSGSDDSGSAYRLRHVYSGIRGESWIALTSVRQSSNGSHYFSSDHTWVSANATGGCSTAF